MAERLPRPKVRCADGPAVADIDDVYCHDGAMTEPPELHTDRPHPARVYDYLLGGKDNFAADREAAQRGLQANPDSRIPPRENRLFLRRAVRFLAEQGIDQFLDIGTGIPSPPKDRKSTR